jgi:hypothetical protein
MPEFVYALCGATSILCAILLARGYARSRSRLLLWSLLCFIGLAINNILLFVDLIVLPVDIDLRPLRNLAAGGGLVLLVAGLILEGI